MSSQIQTIPLIDHNKHSNSKNLARKDSVPDSSVAALNQAKKKQKTHNKARKRSKSFSGGGPSKMKNMRPVLPSRFLLGGNIRDPLNLNSLQDEEINRAMNAVTPKSSPVPTPPRRRGKVEVLIPPNINDPLNLDCADDAEYEQQLCSPIKKCRKKRIRKKRTSSGTSEVADAEENSECTEAKTPETNTDSAKIPEINKECAESDNLIAEPKENKQLILDLATVKKDEKKEGGDKKDNKNKRKSDEHLKDGGGGSVAPFPAKKFKYFAMDKIVSPVVPQPGSWFKRTNGRGHPHHRGEIDRHQNKNIVNEKMPKFKDKHKTFQYGNYNRYYGYRNQHSEVDLRLLCFSNHQAMFEGKDILDIGCNIGHITLSVARDFGAKSVIGIDIDNKLIKIARKNVRHYVKSSETPPYCETDNNKEKSSEFFPISMPILYGPIEIPGFSKESTSRRFPNNVSFKCGNYVLDDDALLSIEQPQFDIILCLSVTKWIHLNWGDAGIKQMFRRIFLQLRPGGKLILEPQNWASYKGKKKLTETIYKNFNSIQLFPDNFTQYLLSTEVGFAKSEFLGLPEHLSKGFQRPIQVYTKSNIITSERSESCDDKNSPAMHRDEVVVDDITNKKSNVINSSLEK